MSPDSVTPPSIDKDLLAKIATTIRGLSIDGVEAANSGHPGLPLGCADFAALLWYYHLRYDPTTPDWADRDRFVLSAGHGSMLVYSLMHLAGYEDMTLDDLKKFRQIDSRAAGHPENFLARGIETTTGPLGQGVGNGIGMGLAAEMMHARFPGLIDCRVYGIVSDGDLMEGVAAEAASFAGHHKLGRVIFFYDDNNITIEGDTNLTFAGEDVGKRFEAYGWYVQRVDGHNFDEMNAALARAQAETKRPSLIVGKTTIGKGSPNKAGTSGVHGSPLGADEAKLTKEALGLPADKSFYIADDVREAWRARSEEGTRARAAWDRKLQSMDPAKRAEFENYFKQDLPDLVALRPRPAVGKSAATRKSAGDALNAYAPALPWLVGGSADLAPSTNTLLKNEDSIGADAYTGRNLHFGVREHGMGAIMNGMVLFGSFRPYGATFLVFSDYMRPSVRLAALMGLPVVYVWTHDSIFLGEDGPTHQPVEHVAALRAIPNLDIIRPADSEEAAVAWEYALRRTDGPTGLILTRQNLPTHDRAASGLAPAEGLMRGGYVLRKESGKLDVILIATGSEVPLALEAADELATKGRGVRVVSMPCLDAFQRLDKAAREEVLPASCRKRVVIEAGIAQGWEVIATEDGAFVTQNGFGKSAPAEVLAEHFGFTKANVVATAEKLLG